jgi:hypothetical protein
MIRRQAALIDKYILRECYYIPRLISVLKMYPTFDSTILNQLQIKHDEVLGTKSFQERQFSYKLLKICLSNVLTLAENHPDTGQDQGFLHIQHTLQDLEEHLQQNVKIYNGYIEQHSQLSKSWLNKLTIKSFSQKRTPAEETSEQV